MTLSGPSATRPSIRLVGQAGSERCFRAQQSLTLSPLGHELRHHDTLSSGLPTAALRLAAQRELGAPIMAELYTGLTALVGKLSCGHDLTNAWLSCGLDRGGQRTAII